MLNIDAVTFDFWNTLMWEGPDSLVNSRMAALLGLIEETGLPVDEAALRRAHAVAFDRYQNDWRANRQFTVPDAVRIMVEHLDIAVDSKMKARLIAAFDAGGDAAELHLAEGVEECLRDLRGRGVRLSIVCDIGLTPSPVLRRHLQRHGLLELFGSWAFSDEIGWYKPDRRIFQHALDGLGGVDSRRAVHVGDRRRTDVAGARSFGMIPVRYTGVYDDPDTEEVDAELVIDDYRSLVEKLEGLRAV